MSNSAIKSVSAAFVTALQTIDSTGSAVTNVCNAARAAFKGESINDADMKGIVTQIADARGWKGVTRKVRESECRVILETYTTLPEAHKKLAPDTYTYHDALKLARCVRKADGNIGKAVAAFKKKPSSTKAAPVPKDRAAKWLGKMYDKANAAKREKILQACELLGITLKQADADDSDDE
jgi:hypothetical protein